MKCFSCDTGVMHARTVTVTETIRDEQYTFETPGMMCDNCANIAFEGKDVSEHQRRLADEYRQAHRLLTSTEIKALREKLGMSQTKFASYLKVGIASIKRWELGAIQDEANDSYLRLKTDLAVAEANCATIRRIEADVHGEATQAFGPTLVLRAAEGELAVSLPVPLDPAPFDEAAVDTANCVAANTQFAYAA